jgi:hypothetical protein
MKSVAVGIVIAAFILGCFYYAVESKKAETQFMSTCVEKGGYFYQSWNWKTVCEFKK